MESLKGHYDVVLANIVADVIIPLSRVVPEFLQEDSIFICSGILNTRLDEVLACVGEKRPADSFLRAAGGLVPRDRRATRSITWRQKPYAYFFLPQQADAAAHCADRAAGSSPAWPSHSCAHSYLGRYVVYSPDGVYFDKTQKLQRTPQTVRTHPTQRSTFETILSALPRRQT